MSNEGTSTRSPYTVVGHTAQRALLARMIHEDRLPSTLLFAGTRSVGKWGVARELATRLLCGSAAPDAPLLERCGTCKSCRLLDAQSHPDLHTLNFSGPDGAGVDDLRQVLDRINLTSFLGGKKVVLFDDADEISVVAANILLKSLEEPRPDTYYILVAANSSRLPATVISRCQRWYFDRLTPLEMRKILDLKGDEYVDVNLDLLFAEGCFSSIEMMQTHPDMWDEVNEAISRAFEGDIARYQHALSTWVTKKDELPARLTLLLAAVQKKLTESVHTPSAAAVWSHAVQNVLDARYLILDRHVNPLLVCSSIMARMSRDLGVRYMSHPNTFETVWEEISRR